jgi:hypothetical protein
MQSILTFRSINWHIVDLIKRRSSWARKNTSGMLVRDHPMDTSGCVKSGRAISPGLLCRVVFFRFALD